MDPTRFTQEFGLTVGILVSVLVALLGGIWRLIQWGLKNVVEPVKDRHLKYLDEENDAKQKQLEIMGKQAAMLQAIQGTQDALIAETSHIKAKVTSIFDKISPSKS
jgi:Flp pilus assembly pilin Flp